jgi:hypothetical protein
MDFWFFSIRLLARVLCTIKVRFPAKKSSLLWHYTGIHRIGILYIYLYGVHLELDEWHLQRCNKYCFSILVLLQVDSVLHQGKSFITIKTTYSQVSQTGRFMRVDPLAEDAYSWTPYRFGFNNPVSFSDPNGLFEWKPELDELGNVGYIAEKGDNAKTLSDQYGLTQKQAERITATKGTEAIAQGTKVSGDKVKEVTGSEVLALDLMNDQTAEQHVFDQYLFAKEYSQAHPSKYNPPLKISGMEITENIEVPVEKFFSNRQLAATDAVSGSSGTVSGRANFNGIPVQYQFHVYNPAGRQNKIFLGSSYNDIHTGNGKNGKFETFRINSYAKTGRSLGRRSFIRYRQKDHKIAKQIFAY